MEEKKHPLKDLMGATMDKIKAMADANTVVGEPIVTGEVTIIPVSQVNIGFGTGGTDFAGKSQKPNQDNCFGGGSAAGMNIIPLGFLIIRGTSVKLLPIAPPPEGAIERVVEMVPELVDKVTDFVEKQQEKKDNAGF